MLRKSEIKPLLQEISKFRNSLEFDEKRTRTEVIEIENQMLVLFDGRPLLFKVETALVPTLFFDSYVSSSPKIVVDKGAIPHICNGADIMAPGVRGLEGTFSSGGFVVVVDENYRKPIAVGRALYDSGTLSTIERGAVVKTLHYVGDPIYNTSKSI